MCDFLYDWLSSEESSCNAGDAGLIPGSGISLGGGNGNPLQYSCLGNPKDRGAWWIQSTGLQRVRQDLVTEHAHAFLKRLSLLLILILLPLRNGTMGMGIVSITGLLLLLLLLLFFTWTFPGRQAVIGNNREVLVVNGMLTSAKLDLQVEWFLINHFVSLLFLLIKWIMSQYLSWALVADSRVWLL